MNRQSYVIFFGKQVIYLWRLLCKYTLNCKSLSSDSRWTFLMVLENDIEDIEYQKAI